MDLDGQPQTNERVRFVDGFVTAEEKNARDVVKYLGTSRSRSRSKIWDVGGWW